MFCRRCGVGVGMDVLILILKKSIILVIFQGRGGPDLPTPISLWIQKSRESVETIDAPQIILE